MPFKTIVNVLQTYDYRGEKEGGINCETGIDINILLYIK